MTDKLFYYKLRMIKYLIAFSLVLLNLIFLCLYHIDLSFNITAIIRLLAPIFLFYFFDPVCALIIVEGVLDSVEPRINRNNIGYHTRDKILDLWGYIVSLVALWTIVKEPYLVKYRIPLTLLFLVRLVGNISFIITKNRRLLSFFPNLYSIVFILLPILGNITITRKHLIKLIIVICLVKVVIEYVHHGSKVKERIKPFRKFMKYFCPGKCEMYRITGTYPVDKASLVSKTPVFKL